MKEQVTVEKLARGMFVADLDRPWLETPFLIQGFVIESHEQIAELQRCCKFVFVERSLSLGDQFRPDATEKAAAPRARADAQLPTRGDDAAAKPRESLFSTLGRIFKSAFSSAPHAEETAQAARVKEPSVIIHPDKLKQKPRVQAAPPLRLEDGISNEERAYLERATDPDASVQIYTEKELAARNSLLRRIARFFGMGGAADKQHSYQRKQAAAGPVYAD